MAPAQKFFKLETASIKHLGFAMLSGEGERDTKYFRRWMTSKRNGPRRVWVLHVVDSEAGNHVI